MTEELEVREGQQYTLSNCIVHSSAFVNSAIPEWTGAPGFIMDSLLTGVEFIKGWQRQLFVAKWSMHQLV